MVDMSKINRNERHTTADTSMEDIVVSVAKTSLCVESKGTLYVVIAV